MELTFEHVGIPAGIRKCSGGEQLWSKAAAQNSRVPQVRGTLTAALRACDAHALKPALTLRAGIRDEGVPLAVNQIQYSLLSRTVGEQVKEVCDELGVGMISYSPLGLGVLGGKYRAGNTK